MPVKEGTRRPGVMAQTILPKIASEMLWGLKPFVRRGEGLVLPGRGSRGDTEIIVWGRKWGWYIGREKKGTKQKGGELNYPEHGTLPWLDSVSSFLPLSEDQKTKGNEWAPWEGLGPTENWYTQDPSRNGANTGSNLLLPGNSAAPSCQVFWFVHETASVGSYERAPDFHLGKYGRQMMASQRCLHPNPGSWGYFRL